MDGMLAEPQITPSGVGSLAWLVRVQRPDQRPQHLGPYRELATADTMARLAALEEGTEAQLIWAMVAEMI